MGSSLIEQMKVVQSFDQQAPPVPLKSITVTVTGSIADASHHGRRVYKWTTWTGSTDAKIEVLIKDFQRKFPVDFGGCEELHLKYNNRLFDKKGQLKQLGLGSKASVELVSFASEKVITENNGFTLAFWSVVPLILAVSLMAAGLIGRFDTALRGAYVLLGSIIGVPAFLCLVVGLTEYKSQSTRVAYVNDAWFGPCCPCCACCAEKEEGNEDQSGGSSRDVTEAPTA
jgi:hypothetical protein